MNAYETKQLLVKTAQQASSASQHNTSVSNIRSQLRRCLFQYTVNCFHDLHGRFLQRFFRNPQVVVPLQPRF